MFARKPRMQQLAQCLGQAKALRKQLRAHLAGKHPELMKKPA